MGLATFIGGIHPYEGKELSENKPVQVLMPKGDLVYPMSQHIGAPAQAIVNVGDMVTEGQMIAQPAQGLSVGIHATISGKVTEVTDRHVVIARN